MLATLLVNVAYEFSSFNNIKIAYIFCWEAKAEKPKKTQTSNTLIYNKWKLEHKIFRKLYLPVLKAQI